MTRAAAFTQADISRAIKGALQAGWALGAFEVLVDPRTQCLRILPASTAPAPPAHEDALDAELREWREARERRGEGRP